MTNKLSISILTPLCTIAQGQADALVAPCPQGEVKILPGHTAFLANLLPGVIVLEEDNHQQFFYITGGFLEIDHDCLVVLAETAEDIKDIDISRAQHDLQEALQKLALLEAESVEFTHETQRADRAQQRLDAAKQFKA